MTCPRCGVKSRDEARFCSTCGLRLDGATSHEGGGSPADAGRLDSAFPAPEAPTMAGPPSGGGAGDAFLAPEEPTIPPSGTSRPDSSFPAPEAPTFLGPPSSAGSRPDSAFPAPDDPTVLGPPSAAGHRSGAFPAPEDATFLDAPSEIRRPAVAPGTVRPVTKPASSRGTRSAAVAAAGGEAGRHEGPLAVGQQFGRYVIIRLLGLGGMGAVYQAWDEELEVAVAVKVIRPEITADPTAAQDLERRFKRELLLARQVTHRNVVRIHDLGELEGIKYITMSYVHGTDLATALQREKRLPVTRVLKILRSVVSGLVAAHEAGVVHRDLKPANIMVEDKSDEPLIMDFGIARSAGIPGGKTGAAGASAGLPMQASSALTNATMAGAVVGTVAYMAPEQARAQEVDQRADLYSLGLICYDLLLGPGRVAEPVKPIDELRQRLEQAPPPPRSIDPEIPEAVDRLVMRCLDPDPAARFQTSAELAAELARLDDNGVPLPVQKGLTRRLAGAAALVGALLIGGTYWIARPAPEKPPPPPTSVLVADFDDQTRNPVFKGTLEQALTTDVEGASFITAYSRQSAQQIAAEIKPGSHLDADMARLVSAREGIKIVLAGAVSRDGDGYALKVDAIDPAVGKVLTTAAASASSPAGILTAVGTIAARLRGALGDTTPESARMAAAETVTTSSLEALQAYARAQDLQAARDDQAALAAYQDAIRFDPKFGRAYAGMGVVYWNMREDAKAKAAYDKALQLVDRMSDRERLRTLGTYYMFIARNYEKAIENYETLVKRFPADDAAHGNLSIAYLFTGNLPRAIDEVREVLKLNPRSTSDRYNYAMYSLYAGDFDTAVKEGERVAKETPDFTPGGLVPVALAGLLRGDRDGALAAYGRLERVSPAGESLGRFGRADFEMYLGRYPGALKTLQASIAADSKGGDTGSLARDDVAAAESYLATGQKARAIETARKATALTDSESVLVPAALVFIEAGRAEEAEKIAVRLENMLQTHMTAYARLISAEIAVSRDRYAQAIELFRDSIKKRDTWLARFLLGRLYARNDHFPEALAELHACFERRGEAADLFFYDTPTARYLPPAIYWLARTQQALGAADAGKLFEQFLALRANADPPDPMAADARRRLATIEPGTNTP